MIEKCKIFVKRALCIIAQCGTYIETLGCFAALRAGLRYVSGSSAVLKIHRPDLAFPLFLRVPSSDVPTYKKIFVDQEYRLDPKQAPVVIVDAGANIGLASIYWAARFPQAKIIALEPEASNFQMLKRNTSQVGNIIPVCAALWGKNEEVELVDPGSGKWGFLAQKKGKGAEGCGLSGTRVQGVTLDRLMADYGLNRVDILKMDIEGSEKEVFDDAAAWIDRVDAVMVELHERLRVGCNRSFYLGTKGFDNEWVQGENVVLTRNKKT